MLDVVLAQSERVLETYRVDPGLVQEHANNERRITQGGYGDRQIYELVQNGADELRSNFGGEIRVVLTRRHLYCANEGNPVTPAGADTILRMSVSRKRGGQIGRFGVGVKSVLSISDAPEFFSSTGSFGFDRKWSAKRIQEVVPEATELPVLRIARPIDSELAARDDPVLSELLEWATTVVRLPLKDGVATRLASDLAKFPVEFPLFSRHVGTVVLEDRRATPPAVRKIFQLDKGERRTLQEERADGTEINYPWRVFTRAHTPSKEALESAGELHDRPEIDLSWAVPDTASRVRERGEFWAYFPTNYQMTLRGIANGPWKTSEDRQNLFNHNPFNEELIQVMAELVVDSLPSLARENDPGAFIDFLPGRGREEPQWAAERLALSVWGKTASRPSLPDQDGVFRLPTMLKLHPEQLRPEWLKLWASCPGCPKDWCHHSVETRERRARVELIMTNAHVEVASIREWLEALAHVCTPETSGIALRILADIKRAAREQMDAVGRARLETLFDEASQARILLTEQGRLLAPSPGSVFRRSSVDTLEDQIVYVDERLVDEPEVLSALDVLGIHDADAAGRLRAVVQQGFAGYSKEQWIAFWDLARQAGPAETLDAVRDHKVDSSRSIKVLTMAGQFKPIRDCLAPGPVVPDDGSRDERVAVDTVFHQHDQLILERIGLLHGPMEHQDPRTETWYELYVEAHWKQHLSTLSTEAHRVQMRTMQFDGAAPAGPLHVFFELSDEGRAAFLGALPHRGLVTNWTMQVGRQSSTRRRVPSPLVWAAREFGYLRTSKGLMPVLNCVAPALRIHKDLLAVAVVDEPIAAAFGLPAKLADIPQPVWNALVSQASASEDDEFPGRVYALLIEAEAEWPPYEMTRCRVGDRWSSDVEDSKIAVTADRAEYEVLVREGLPALLVPTSEVADQLVEKWELLAPSQVIEKEIRFAPETEPTQLLDEFPHLKVSHRARVEGWSIVRCSSVEEITRTPNGMRSSSLDEAIHERSVLVRNPKNDLAALTAVDRALKLGLGEARCRSILEMRRRQHEDERLRRVRRAKTDAQKLLELVGEDDLKRGLPPGLLVRESAKLGHAPDAVRVAELAVNAHGASVLRHHSKDIETRVPDAPSSYTGGTRARAFVSEIGLSDVYAGSRGQALEPVEIVPGPSAYPRLHDYQERIASRTYQMLTGATAARAMLTLPTGAGKTRVAAEAVIRVFKEPGLRGPVLWIAQTEELCEQAVQSWKFVWEKVGADRPLTINRLWSSREATAVDSGPHLVVATDAKLEVCLYKDEYAWLRDAAVVIVDEAHTAYARMTPILRSLGIAYNKAERPLIGLTATPFRGYNEEETRLLVDRYGNVRLDEGVFDGDPHIALQKLGVLAKVEHRELRGATLELTADELKGSEFRGLASSAEQRLATDSDRNDMLLGEIKQLPGDWPVLLFATSVDHAKLMSAVLNDEGIRSAAIDSYTPPTERRSRIDDFRTRKIRVLTNYGVLAQGFDAPATRAVIVARPTFSPNTYIQMIGRGLRGPKNGGNEVCTILDVHDNIVNYHHELAFTEFEYLWRSR